MTKKVAVHVVAIYHAFIYCGPHRCSQCCIVHRHSTASGSPHDAVASFQYRWLPHCISIIVLVAVTDVSVLSLVKLTLQLFYLHCQLHNCHQPDQAMIASTGHERNPKTFICEVTQLGGVGTHDRSVWSLFMLLMLGGLRYAPRKVGKTDALRLNIGAFYGFMYMVGLH